MLDEKEFAENMSSQARELAPAEFSSDEVDLIAENIKSFILLAGEGLNKEDELDDNQKIFIAQLIAEWTFHKTVDIIRAKIPPEYSNAILQKIAPY